MFLGYASQHGHALIDRALYLPKEWAEDADRRREARVPAEIAFTTKPAKSCGFARRSRALPCWNTRGLRACPFPGANAARFAWITGDSVYGADHAIRRWAERHRRGYVLAVTSGQRLGLRPVTAWTKKLPKRAWQRLSAGDGAKGPRFYDWACLPYNKAVPGFQCALLGGLAPAHHAGHAGPRRPRRPPQGGCRGAWVP